MIQPNKKKLPDKLLEKIDQIQTFIQNSHLTEVEADNLVSDLQGIYQRLVAGHYRDTDFLSRNIFDIPRRTREFLNYFHGYQLQAKTWAEVLKQLPLSKVETVIDLCPGWAPKIELALAKIKYQGKVIIFDLDKSCFNKIQDFMSMFDISYNLIFEKGDFFSSAKSRGDLVVANHVIDDLLIYKYRSPFRYSLKEIYDSEKKYKEVAKQVLLSFSHQESLIKEISINFDCFVNNDGFLVISQYRGLWEKALRLKKWSVFCQNIMNGVKSYLLQKNYQDYTGKIVPILARLDQKYFSSRDVFVLRKS